ncbi:8-amino-7-oxononanoate synthase [Candidatus Omnitrophota bacterium]
MERIESFLQERRDENLLRVLRPANKRSDGKIFFGDKEMIDLSSNDYLGLSSHPKMKEVVKSAVDQYGAGASASRLLSGDLNLHHELEEKIAMFKKKESALLFNSGYQANVGIISSICKQGDLIFSDKLNHASIIDGILLSGATFHRFLHNNMDHLKTLLEQHRPKAKQALIITETIFSMDGDKAPLKDIVRLAREYSCLIMVDEAHATGVFSADGSGMVSEEGLSSDIDIIMGTFSKALGSFGAYVGCSQLLKDYLINSSRSFIYSTALPPSVVAANLASLDLVREEVFRRKSLLENSNYFRNRLIDRGFQTKGSSQIVPLILGDNQSAINMALLLETARYRVLPIRYPTVAKNQARIRFSLNYYHQKDMLEKLIESICEINKVCVLR